MTTGFYLLSLCLPQFREDAESLYSRWKWFEKSQALSEREKDMVWAFLREASSNGIPTPQEFLLRFKNQFPELLEMNGTHVDPRKLVGGVRDFQNRLLLESSPTVEEALEFFRAIIKARKVIVGTVMEKDDEFVYLVDNHKERLRVSLTRDVLNQIAIKSRIRLTFKGTSALDIEALS